MDWLNCFRPSSWVLAQNQSNSVNYSASDCKAIHVKFTPWADLNNLSMACEGKPLTPEPHTGFTGE